MRALRSLSVALGLSLCLAWPTARAEGLVDATAQWANALVRCLAAFQSCFDKIADEAQRRNLADRLSQLNTDLYRLEKSKQLFVVSLERRRLRPEELRAVAEDIQRDVDDARRAFQRLGAFLRKSERGPALEAERALDDALLQRKLFIEDLLRALDEGKSVDTSEMAKAGRSAVDALRQAQVELNKVLEVLEEE